MAAISSSSRTPILTTPRTELSTPTRYSSTSLNKLPVSSSTCSRDSMRVANPSWPLRVPQELIFYKTIRRKSLPCTNPTTSNPTLRTTRAAMRGSWVLRVLEKAYCLDSVPQERWRHTCWMQ
jgi:hypothetical protein